MRLLSCKSGRKNHLDVLATRDGATPTVELIDDFPVNRHADGVTQFSEIHVEYVRRIGSRVTNLVGAEELSPAHHSDGSDREESRLTAISPTGSSRDNFAPPRWSSGEGAFRAGIAASVAWIPMLASQKPLERHRGTVTRGGGDRDRLGGRAPGNR